MVSKNAVPRIYGPFPKLERPNNYFNVFDCLRAKYRSLAAEMAAASLAGVATFSFT